MAKLHFVPQPNQPQPREWQAVDLSQDYVGAIKYHDAVDGPGYRVAVYLSGCKFNCPGCYNKAVQSFHYGQPFTDQMFDEIMHALAEPYYQGLTLLGGEPFLNTRIAIRLAEAVRSRFPDKNIWSWSGYTYEQLRQETADKQHLLSLIDVLVDGPFLEAKKDLTLQFRGSANQRVIDVPNSLSQDKVVIWPRLLR
ncbi:anaerobic ribonucleoside-triphosphate reductase activating protein [Lacticaseibacillus brantae]|uniref:Anaerobic ribonucleoside-triphosphate reductase-activating protein n=1 Tax=Lacticaseibacillus brantae DSM 23927 TaxID=1423727 RepID=A0A0R2B465_9LACO|nr:anaerobic ribonucleoside-triphosphate reductase activating protein [Lacticaseibacillus brantae]KRM72740.1 anaerobic ribonucleoside-triphosphate reductase activating protein [Lacticaseibacillus brantae DSM 23927]